MTAAQESPDYPFLGSVIIQQKRLSGKMSWTTHPSMLSADKATRAAKTARDRGRPYRFIYRINVWAKGPAQ